MRDPTLALFKSRRSNWVRLRTLVVLRWIAIAGQLGAITVAQRLFNLDLELGLCFLAIGASVLANLIAIFIFPENKRLSESEVVSMLLFDISQLSFLLYLTGGLHNPFALLILVPVTISATALRPATTAALGGIAILFITIVTEYYVPLRTDLGFIMRMPTDFVFGFWVAIVIGVIFLAAFAQRVTAEIHAMSDALVATQMALAREQKLTDLGGVVAAAAHELGTPLATIKLVSSELMDELEHHPDLRGDAELIRDQAERCRDILASMGQSGKEDQHLKHAPISAVASEAAEPHAARGKTIQYDVAPSHGAAASQPIVARRPEVVHGLRNLVQNAVDFAQSTVWIEIRWTGETITVRITDDGPGFPAHVLGRIGDPFVTSRRGSGESTERPGYSGMGLGLFIAKTLLERSGAEVTFANAREPFGELSRPGQPFGAVIECIWRRSDPGVEIRPDRRPLGQNAAIEI